MTQLALVDVSPTLKLTAQQQLVLAALQRAPDGLHADECGALAHTIMESRWRHSADDRCQFCGSRGLQILHSLRDKGLVRYRARLKVWQATSLESEPQAEGWDGHGMLSASEPLPF